MSFHSSPDSNNLSLETEEQVALRLGGQDAPSSSMQELREAKASGDLTAIAAATKAADALYAVEPLHDGHVGAFNEKKAADFDEAITANLEKANTEFDNPEVVRLRVQRMYEALPKFADSEVSGLIDAINLKIEVLADKSPTFLASDSLSNLARDLSINNPDTFEAVLTREKNNYLDGIKSKLKEQGYNPRIIDILNSSATREDKTKQLEQISFSI